jgi:hypothetical protein
MALDAVALPAGGLAVDPFTGSGRAATTLAARGDRFFGLEAHPLPADLANVKLSRPGPPNDLRQAANDVADRAATGTRGGVPHPVLQRFVSPSALPELIDLRAATEEHGGPWEGHMRWLVLGALRRHAGGGWPYLRPRATNETKSPTQLVVELADTMADDLSDAPREPRAEVAHADARVASSWAALTPGAAHGCVSSPPYLNQVSYAELLRLEVLLLGWAQSWADMRLLGRDLVACCTQEVTAQRAATARVTLGCWPGTEASVRSLCGRLERAQASRSRPKRYDRLLVTYFADIGRSLQALWPVLAPGARSAWVIGDSAPYGVYVDTPALIGLLATELGYDILDDVQLRERGKRWSSPGSRHSRRLSERLLVFQRPGWGEQLELELAT